jgi:hypothetical protein
MPERAGRFLEEPKRCLNSILNILHSRSTRMHRHECNTHWTNLFNLENQTMTFSYTRFPVNKINVEINFKIMRKSLFSYSFYSHPKKFQGVTNLPLKQNLVPRFEERRTRRREIIKLKYCYWGRYAVILFCHLGVGSSVFIFLGHWGLH